MLTHFGLPQQAVHFYNSTTKRNRNILPKENKNNHQVVGLVQFQTLFICAETTIF